MEKNELQKNNSNKKTIQDLSYDEQVRIVFDCFNGVSDAEIKKTYNLSTAKTIHTLMQLHKYSKSNDTAYRVAQLNKVRENDRIHKIKERVYDLIEKTVEDEMARDSIESDGVGNMTKIKDILGKMDEIYRLNNDEATSNVRSETITKHIDISEVLKQLPTQEDKLRFLQKRAEYGNENN